MHFIDLTGSFPNRLQLQNSASIQPRMILLKHSLPACPLALPPSLSRSNKQSWIRRRMRDRGSEIVDRLLPQMSRPRRPHPCHPCKEDTALERRRHGYGSSMTCTYAHGIYENSQNANARGIDCYHLGNDISQIHGPRRLILFCIVLTFVS